MVRQSTFYLGKSEWLDNREKGLCICGKPQGSKQLNLRKYCSYKCRDSYQDSWTTWSMIRDKLLTKRGRKCEKCGATPKDIKPTTLSVYDYFEVDHIKAIVNGGSETDESNLQVLCHPCHVKKTKIDMMKRDNKIGEETLQRFV